MVKTFFTSVKIPGITAMDFHLVGGRQDVYVSFQKDHNKDDNASCTPWEPAIFDAAADGTKHRTVKFASQMKAPKWLLKLIGTPTLPIIDYQSTTLNRKTGNVTFHCAPIIQNHGPNGEFSIAEMHWDVLNRLEPDGSPFVMIDVTLTAKADYAWLWGLQTAVESIFISQAKDDIAAYLQYNIRIFREMLAAGKVPSQNGITSDDHPGEPASSSSADEADALQPLPNGRHAAPATSSNPKAISEGQDTGALYTNDSVSVYYDASEKLRQPRRRSGDGQRAAAAAHKPLPKAQLEKQQRQPALSPRRTSPQSALSSALSPRGGGAQVNGPLAPRTPAKTASILKGAKSPRTSQRSLAQSAPSTKRAPATPPLAAPEKTGSQTERYDERDKVRRMCQEWAEESVPLQPKTARGESGRLAGAGGALSPRSRERECIRVTTPATPKLTPRAAAADHGPAAEGSVAVKAAAAKSLAELGLPEGPPAQMDREGRYYIIMPSSQERFHTPANSLLPASRQEVDKLAPLTEAPNEGLKAAATSKSVRRIPNPSPTPAQKAAGRPLARKSATNPIQRSGDVAANDLGDPGPGMAAVEVLPPMKSVSAPCTPRSKALSPRVCASDPRWADDSHSFRSQKKRPSQLSRLGSGVRFEPGDAVEYGDARWPGHIVAVEEDANPMSPRTPFPPAKRVSPMAGQESRNGLSPRPVLKTGSKKHSPSSQGMNGKHKGVPEASAGHVQTQAKSTLRTGDPKAAIGQKKQKASCLGRLFCGSAPATEN